MSRDEPLINEKAAGHLAGVINRAAASFDVASLAAEEAMEIFMVLERPMITLWDAHQQVLIPIYESMLRRYRMEHGVDGDNDGESGGSSGDMN